jgi:hypothetical protein
MVGDQGPYEEGKRAGAHPILVVLGVILGLWLLIWLAVPSGKQKQATAPEPLPAAPTEDPEAAPVLFKVHATLTDVNAVSIVVPPQATNSQVASLLKQFHRARLDGTLGRFLPPTTPGHKLGNNAVVDVYIFSDPKAADPEAVRTLSRGAHAPGHLYPQAVPFEVVMESVRGHYRIDLNDTGNPDTGSLGFADESGIHSQHYRRIF